jgi:hypothetical protein
VAEEQENHGVAVTKCGFQQQKCDSSDTGCGGKNNTTGGQTLGVAVLNTGVRTQGVAEDKRKSIDQTQGVAENKSVDGAARATPARHFP